MCHNVVEANVVLVLASFDTLHAAAAAAAVAAAAAAAAASCFTLDTKFLL